MTLIKSNTAEGGVDGATVTTSDTGSGDGWNTVTITAGGGLTYTTVAGRGSMGYLSQSNALSVSAFGAFTGLSTTAGATRVGSVLLRRTANPLATLYFMRALGTAGIDCWRVFLSTSGTFGLADAANLTVWTSAPQTIPLSQWVRVEVASVVSSTVGSLRCKVWFNAGSSGTPDIDSGTVSATLADSLIQMRYGNTTSSNTIDTWWDDAAVADDYTGYLGGSTNQQLVPTSDVTTTGWTATGGTGTKASAVDELVADDTDYVTSPTNPSSSVLEVKLQAGGDPGVDSGHTFEYRIRALSATSSSVTVGLYQGATLIASEVRSAVPSTFTTYTMNLTNVQAAAITDYTNLRLRFTATAS